MPFDQADRLAHHGPADAVVLPKVAGRAEPVPGRQASIQYLGFKTLRDLLSQLGVLSQDDCSLLTIVVAAWPVRAPDSLPRSIVLPAPNFPEVAFRRTSFSMAIL